YTAKGAEAKFEGAVVLGGALHGSQGLVPLGITAGLDADGDGKVDADGEAGTTAGNLALRVAPLHSGMETSRYAALALAASFGGLVSGEDTEGPGLVLSGAVAFPESLSYNASTAAPLAFPTFLTVPTDPAINGQTLTTTAVDGASFHRLSIGSVESGEWLVYFPAGKTSVELPVPPEGFDNRLTKLDGDELPEALLHSIRVGANGALTYDQVVAFDAANLDDLSARIDSFSVIEIERPLPQ
ncbi:MAG: hypothetical protein ACLGG9_01405, partial [Thermoleophilia bacterium]